MDTIILLQRIVEYTDYLHHEERSHNTIAKYVRDLRAFFSYLEKRDLNKEAVLAWKDQLCTTHSPRLLL